ncbi:MAG: hypothetical protein EPN47_09740 [Acidobacteria bacterium]|nr:MAG: hypothetical protein EPN47_09740 [Acidobacteriota bacterium]
MRIFLEFSPDQNWTHRTRLTYAFRLFCAIHGHSPLLEPAERESADVVIHYPPGLGNGPGKPVLRLSNLYRPRSPLEPAPPPKRFGRDNETTATFYSPPAGHEPDWLGEVFEWVSCADEYSVKDLDPCGRVPFEASYVGRHKLDARVPHAAVAMWFLQKALDAVTGRVAGRTLTSAEFSSHFVIATHDVDYLPVGRANCVMRLGKNAASSWLEGKSRELAFDQIKMAARRCLTRRDPLAQVPNVVEGEKQRGVNSSFYFLTRHLHRRDANYTSELPELRDLAHSLEREGMEVGVHGSYRCLEESDGLPGEYIRLRKLGLNPQGGRQHWLRFTLDRLIPSLERSGALYDTSIGWVERIGYRAGACFAFPPYNFREERPATFLEIPLAAMDLSLRFEFGGEGKADGFAEVAKLLATSRRYGWGGISLLWHPRAFGGGWMSRETGDIYWKLLDHRWEWKDKWLTAIKFVQATHQRYSEVGLLPAVHVWGAAGENARVCDAVLT